MLAAVLDPTFGLDFVKNSSVLLAEFRAPDRRRVLTGLASGSPWLGEPSGYAPDSYSNVPLKRSSQVRS